MQDQYDHAAHASVDSDSPGVWLMPPAVFYFCLLAGGAAELVWGSDFQVYRPLRLAAGGVLLGTGFWFMMWGHGIFKRLGTSVRTIRPATVLVIEGAYRYSRNPMYVGMTVMLLGLGIAIGSVWMTGIVIVLPLYFAFYVVPREEAYMERRWGEAYAAYRRRVRRWL